jgi:hypothetical protein
MWEALQEAQEAIFKYNIPEASKRLVEIFDTLSELQERWDNHQQEQLQEILQILGLALQNQDYMLAADLLEYGLKPLVGVIFQ